MEKAYVVRFHFFQSKVRLFSVYFMDYDTKPDAPLLKDGKIVFFRRLSTMREFMRRNHSQDVIENTTCTYIPEDLIGKIYRMENDGGVMDMIYMYDDYLTALLGEEFVLEKTDGFFPFYECATFDPDIKKFFKESTTIKPQDIIDYINLATGIIVNNSIIL